MFSERMYNYAQDLANSIDNLSIIKNEIYNSKIFNKKLCHCRREILENYILAAQLLYVRVTGKTLKLLETNNSSFKTDELFDFSNLREWFKFYAYDFLYSEDLVSKKMIILYKKMQEYIDVIFFDFLETEFNDKVYYQIVSGVDETTVAKSLTYLYEKMNDWFEAAVFNILSLTIDCNNVDHRILEGEKIPNTNEDVLNYCLHNTIVNDKDINENINCRKCMKCYGVDAEGCKCHLNTINNNEYIHMILVPEMFKNENWILGYVDLLSKYIINKDKIKFIIDYKIYNEPLNWNINNYNRFKKIIDNFQHVYIINYSLINFREYEDLVKPYLRDANEEEIKKLIKGE